jgi:hypothetical protein
MRVLIYCFSVVLFLGCIGLIGFVLFKNHYDYGVDRENFRPDCASYFDNGSRYDFSTIVWAAGGDCRKPINGNWWSPYFVYTTHVTIEGKDAYYLELHFAENVNRKIDASVIKESIRVTLVDKDGHVIPHHGASYGANAYRSTYKQVYQQKLGAELIENISFDLSINGSVIRIEKSYPVGQHPHYNFWDQLMGI